MNNRKSIYNSEVLKMKVLICEKWHKNTVTIPHLQESPWNIIKSKEQYNVGDWRVWNRKTT